MKLHRLLILPAAVAMLAGTATLATPGTVSADEFDKPVQQTNRVSCFNSVCSQANVDKTHAPWETHKPSKPEHKKPVWSSKSGGPNGTSARPKNTHSAKSDPKKDSGKGGYKSEPKKDGYKSEPKKSEPKKGTPTVVDSGKGGASWGKQHDDSAFLDIKVGNLYNDIRVNLSQSAAHGDAEANLTFTTQNASAINFGDGTAEAENASNTATQADVDQRIE